MAKIIDRIDVSGIVSRIYFSKGDQDLSKILLMLDDNPDVYELHLKDSAYLPSVKLTKPGDTVHFVFHKKVEFMFGPYDELVDWSNCTLQMAQASPKVSSTRML